MASPTQDDGFHEIQLNGKQLVFLFMAATVVSVVIFLCGVFVGRGVRAERNSTIADAGANAPRERVDAAAARRHADAGARRIRSDRRRAAAGRRRSQLLQPPRETESRPEKLKQPPAKGAGRSAAARAAAAPRQPRGAARQMMPAARPWAVQVAALNVRAEADAIAKRLSSKGYAAYVVAPTDGTSVYRVRVGKFNSQREAEPLKAKLEKRRAVQTLDHALARRCAPSVRIWHTCAEIAQFPRAQPKRPKSFIL